MQPLQVSGLLFCALAPVRTNRAFLLSSKVHVLHSLLRLAGETAPSLRCWSSLMEDFDLKSWTRNKFSKYHANIPGRPELFQTDFHLFSIIMQKPNLSSIKMWREKEKGYGCFKRHRSQRNRAKETGMWPLRSYSENKFSEQSSNVSWLDSLLSSAIN